jgi:hypothetical protein
MQPYKAFKGLEFYDAPRYVEISFDSLIVDLLKENLMGLSFLLLLARLF